MSSKQFNTKGLSRAALEGTYELNLVQFLVLEAKINRIKSEMAVAICAIEDKEIKEVGQVKRGLENLIAYIECKSDLPTEFTPNIGSLDILEIHLQKIKDYEEKRARGEI